MLDSKEIVKHMKLMKKATLVQKLMIIRDLSNSIEKALEKGK